ncbi:MAG: tRNA(Met) cytidine acetyltransferase TmcA [Halobacteriales archaeon]
MATDVADVAAALREEAQAANERRLLVLAGSHEATLDAAETALEAAGIDRTDAVAVGEGGLAVGEQVAMDRAGDLLGTTNVAVVFDAHAGLRPTALGRVVGAVDGGGLLLLCCPPLADWPERRDPADERLAVPPFEVADVTGRFRRRFVRTLYAHRGVAVVDVDAGVVEADGLTDPAPRAEPFAPEPPPGHAFPAAAYEACLTADQVDALRALEALREPGQAVVVESDRGRGKSSVAGLAAACLAAAGEDVGVTAPRYRSARELFVRAGALLESLDAREGTDGDEPRELSAIGGGRVRYVEPTALASADVDVLIVDEAAGLGVPVLADCLAVDRVAFATTVHGYEGAGRGFSVRFRDRLEAGHHAVTDATLEEPIRYAAGDPVEVWAFRALLLDARPAVDAVVADARPASVAYRHPTPEALLEDEALLRELFGLLVLAHYRTEPDDLARLLDAPNVTVRALLADGHVVSVALLAREGGLPAELREHLYEGGRVRGNMLPDVLTSQLRDEAAGEPVGWRVLRIATHDAVRSRGLGSRLLEELEAEVGDGVDWFGTGYGATPELVSFWADAGYETVHLATTRNAESGEHSALMLRPASDDGRALADRHGAWFARRVVDQLTDALRDLDPDVVRGALRAADAAVEPDLDDRDWRLVAGMAYGPGLLDVDPGPFRELAAAHLLDPDDPDRLDADAERLLVRRVLQGRRWGTVADELGFHSRAECMRATGMAFRPLVEAYGTEAALAERERYGT